MMQMWTLARYITALFKQTLACDACRQRWGIEGLEKGQPLVEACQADGRSKYELSGGAPRCLST